MTRHADHTTLEHIIDLRKEIQRLDKELEQYKQAYDKILTEQIKLIQELKLVRSELQSERQQVFDLGH